MGCFCMCGGAINRNPNKREQYCSQYCQEFYSNK
jgi:hypothetical protein